MRLSKIFYDQLKSLKGVKFYGDFSGNDRLPIISINIEGFTSSELALILWEKYGIATRAGSHCAPLLHKRFNTIDVVWSDFHFRILTMKKKLSLLLSHLKILLKVGRCIYGIRAYI